MQEGSVFWTIVDTDDHHRSIQSTLGQWPYRVSVVDLNGDRPRIAAVQRMAGGPVFIVANSSLFTSRLSALEELRSVIKRRISKLESQINHLQSTLKDIEEELIDPPHRDDFMQLSSFSEIQ